MNLCKIEVYGACIAARLSETSVLEDSERGCAVLLWAGPVLVVQLNCLLGPGDLQRSLAAARL